MDFTASQYYLSLGDGFCEIVTFFWSCDALLTNQWRIYMYEWCTVYNNEKYIIEVKATEKSREPSTFFFHCWQFFSSGNNNKLLPAVFFAQYLWPWKKEKRKSARFWTYSSPKALNSKFMSYAQTIWLLPTRWFYCISYSTG